MVETTHVKTGTSSSIAIIGAGPVGLYAALLLAQAGIDVTVFEKSSHVSRSPRAIAYFPVVKKDFEKAGILEDVIAAGYVNLTGATWRKPKDGGKLAHVGGDDPSKSGVHLGQDKLAEIILEKLKEFPNVSILFETSLQSFEVLEAEDRVSLYCTRVDGTSVQHHSRYVIGADGGRSTVRRLLGLSLEGFTWDDFNIIAANIVYDLETMSDWGPANFIVDPELWSVVAKTGKGPNWRVATGSKGYEGVTEDTWDEGKALIWLKTRLRDLLPGSVETADVVQIAPYKMHQRCVSNYRQGNIVLAGDAAHLTNPVGGLGLTTGLLDASMLAQVLERVFCKGASSDLLNEYATTRRNVFVNYTDPTATANRQRLLATDDETNKERSEFFARVNEPDIPFLVQMFEDEMGIATSLALGPEK